MLLIIAVKLPTKAVSKLNILKIISIILSESEKSDQMTYLGIFS